MTNYEKLVNSSQNMANGLCVFAPKDDTEVIGATQLEEILCSNHDETIKDLKVAIISVAGRYRQGKSFLLNLMIKYLRSEGSLDWLQDENELEGFDWGNSRTKITRGVLIWPEVFKLRRSNGEDIAVILMDTQGVFDTESTMKESTSIFSFSFLLSSVQIFNVLKNIHGDDLRHLEMFTDYGRLISLSGAAPDSEYKPFQDLVFLIRDWSYPHEEPFGWEGGQRVLDEELNKTELESELQRMRKTVNESFQSIRCYLMPHPGRIADASPHFRGRISEIEPDFVRHMENFVEDLFVADRLQTKAVNGAEISLKDFFVFVQTYSLKLSSKDLPTPKTLCDATKKGTNFATFRKCCDMYCKLMKNALDDSGSLNHDTFAALHHKAYEVVMSHFDTSMKLGAPRILAELAFKLKAKIEESYITFEALNLAAVQKKRYAERVLYFEKEKARLRREAELAGQVTAEMMQNLTVVDERIRRWTEMLDDSRREYDKALLAAKNIKGSVMDLIGCFMGSFTGAAVVGIANLRAQRQQSPQSSK